MSWKSPIIPSKKSPQERWRKKVEKSTLSLTENVFSRQIQGLLLSHGFFPTYHTWTSVNSPAGFPDIVTMKLDEHGVRLLFIELKTDRGILTAPQKYWLMNLAWIGEKCPGIEVYVWRPRDSESILRTLRGESEGTPQYPWREEIKPERLALQLSKLRGTTTYALREMLVQALANSQKTDKKIRRKKVKKDTL